MYEDEQKQAGASTKTLSKNPSQKSFVERTRHFEEVQSEFEQRLKYYEE